VIKDELAAHTANIVKRVGAEQAEGPCHIVGRRTQKTSVSSILRRRRPPLAKYSSPRHESRDASTLKSGDVGR
jgi:hypothetical protein